MANVGFILRGSEGDKVRTSNNRSGGDDEARRRVSITPSTAFARAHGRAGSIGAKRTTVTVWVTKRMRVTAGPGIDEEGVGRS